MTTMLVSTGVTFPDSTTQTTAAGANSTVVQIKNYQTGAYASTTTKTPNDDTIPQITEGAEFMNLAFTPTSATNRLMIEIVVNTTYQQTNLITIALFLNTTANSIAAVGNYQVANHPTSTGFNHNMVAGSTSELTFRVRCGANGTDRLDFNGAYGSRKRGGVAASGITITEYEV